MYYLRVVNAFDTGSGTLLTASTTWRKRGMKMNDFHKLRPKRVWTQLAGKAMKSCNNSWRPRIIYDNEH
jgi:hypothetical protein